MQEEEMVFWCRACQSLIEDDDECCNQTASPASIFWQIMKENA